LQQTGVLAGHDAVHIPALIQTAVVGQAATAVGAVFAAAMAHQTSHSIPEDELIAGHRLAITAALAAQQRRLGAHLDTCARDRPDALALMTRDFHQ
jgi:hypothetical protein